MTGGLIVPKILNQLLTIKARRKNLNLERLWLTIIDTMALISLSELLGSETNLDILAGKTGSLYNVLRELQGLSFTVVNGANADTNIAVSGIVTTDTLLAVLEFTISGGNLNGINNKTSTSSITSAGNIQCTDSTATSRLIVVWYNKA